MLDDITLSYMAVTLERLTLAMILSNKAEQSALNIARNKLAEIGVDIAQCPSNSIPADYVRASGEEAWEKSFGNESRWMSLPPVVRLCMDLPRKSGLQTAEQYIEGLITTREAINWIQNELAILVGPAVRLRIGLVEAPKVRPGVEL